MALPIYLGKADIMTSLIAQIAQILGLFIQLCTIATLIYGFSKFLSKPTATLKGRVEVTEKELSELMDYKDRVNTLEKEMRTLVNRTNRVDERLENGNLRFKAQEESNRVTQSAILALIDKEIKDSVAEQKEVPQELTNARQDLYDYLTDR